MIRFHQGAPLREGRVGVFPGAFNPITNAHLALGRAARKQHELDQVAFVLPSQFPHKYYSDAGFEDRLWMLREGLREETAAAVCSTSGGLFIEIYQEFRSACGTGPAIYFLCGSDAAERIVGWDYGNGPSIAAQLQEFEILVASRGKPYRPPDDLRARIHGIGLAQEFSAMSSTKVREAIRSGKDWRQLVPRPAAELIEQKRLYGVSDWEPA